MLIISEAVQRLFGVNSADGCNSCVNRLKISAAYKTNSVLHFLRDHVISFVFNESMSLKVQDNVVRDEFGLVEL